MTPKTERTGRHTAIVEIRSMRIFWALFVAVTMLLLSGTSAAWAEKGYRIIVHKDNPTKSLSKKRVSQLLLKEVSTWEDGLSVQPVGLGGEFPLRRSAATPQWSTSSGPTRAVSVTSHQRPGWTASRS